MGNIKDYLQQNGSSLYQLAKNQNFHYPTIYNANRGQFRNIRLEIIIAIANELNKSSGEVVDDLLKIHHVVEKTREVDDLKGFISLLRKYGYKFPDLEQKLRERIKQLEKKGSSYLISLFQISKIRFTKI